MKDENNSKLSPQDIAKLEAKMIGEVAKKPKILWLTSKLNTALVSAEPDQSIYERFLFI